MAFLLLFTASAACRTAPEEIEPPVQVPEAFTRSGTEPLPDRWWFSFGDLELNRLVEIALADNLDLQTAWDRLAQAEAVARREGADLEPSLDVLAGASRTATRYERPGGSKDTDYFSEYSLGAVAGYEVDLWGRVHSISDAAELDARAGAMDLQAGAITLSAQVARTWYQLVEQYGQLDVISRQLDTNAKVLELVTLRFRKSQVGAADVLRQQQLVESNRGEMDLVESRAKVLEHQLSILLGRPPDTPVAERAKDLIELPPLPDAGLPLELLQRRPDIRKAEFQVLAADRRVATAIADRFPRLMIFARADTSGEVVGDLFETWLARIAGDLVAPVLDGGRRTAEVDRTRAVLSESLHDYGQAVLRAFAEVEDALVQERKQREFIASLEKQLELSDHVVERIRDSYTKGAVDYLRILEALASNQSLQRSVLAARRQLIEFRIDLCRALAGGFDMQHPELAALEDEPGEQAREIPRGEQGHGPE